MLNGGRCHNVVVNPSVKDAYNCAIY